MPDHTVIAIRFPAAVYFYGPFPSVPGMSRPRTLYGATPAPSCPVIVADTPAAATRLDSALLDVARFAAANPPGAFVDAAQWLTNREIRHAADLAGCKILEPEQCATDGCAAPSAGRPYFVEYKTPTGRIRSVRVTARDHDGAVEAAVTATGCDFADIQTVEARGL